MENKIKEAIKTDNGNIKYVVQLEQDGVKLQLYISNSNKIYFDSNNYGWDNYKTFDINEEAHRVSKEIFITYLQAEVKSRLLELKQLELILDELGLKEIVRKTIMDNSSILINEKDKIIEESINNTNRLTGHRKVGILKKKLD